MRFLALIVPVLAWAGLCASAHRRLGLDWPLATAFSACGICAAMTAAGLAGAMKPAAAVLYVLGLGEGVWAVVRRKRDGGWRLPKMYLALLGLAAAYAAWRFAGARFTHYDAFSHWGVAARYVIREGRLVAGDSPLVTFPSYPAGAAAFGFFFLWLPGFSEGLFLAVQFLFTAACLLSETAFGEKRGWPGRALTCAALLVCVTLVGSLTPLVDTLLSAAAVAAFAVLWRYRDDPKRAALYALPMALDLAWIKASGLLFLAMLCAGQLYFARGLGRKEKWRCFLPLAAGVAAYAAWMLHVNASFENWQAAKHSASLSYFRAIAGSKSLSMVGRIALEMARQLLTSSPASLILLILLLVSGAAALVSRRAGDREAAKRYGRLLAAQAVLTAAYLAALFAMYLFSMPTAEALRLASFERYLGSMLIVLLGGSWIFHLEYTLCRERTAGGPSRAPALIAAAGCLAMAAVNLRAYPAYVQRAPGPEDQVILGCRDALADAAQYGAEGETLIVIDQSNPPFEGRNMVMMLTHAGRYEFESEGVRALDASQGIDLSEFEGCGLAVCLRGTGGDPLSAAQKAELEAAGIPLREYTIQNSEK